MTDGGMAGAPRFPGGGCSIRCRPTARAPRSSGHLQGQTDPLALLTHRIIDSAFLWVPSNRIA